MPVYELNLVTKVFQKPEALVVVRRVVDYLWKQKALVREIEFLGSRTFPFKFLVNNEFHWKGMHWLITFDMPPKQLVELRHEFKRDLDILRTFTQIPRESEETVPVKWECNVEEESLPPAYRADVKALMQHGKRPIPWRQL